jgi:ABC-type multidrug transport system ATPase subunit
VRREKVRQWILASRQSAAVLVSTHHVDDISILSDQVWYLNDRYLGYDGPLSRVQDMQFSTPAGSISGRSLSRQEQQQQRQQFGSGSSVGSGSRHASAAVTPLSRMKRTSTSIMKKTVRFSEFGISWGQKALEFNIGSSEILSKFKQAIAEDSAASLLWGADASRLLLVSGVEGRGDRRSNKSYLMSVGIPGHLNSFLFAFIQALEKVEVTNWSIASPNVFKAVTAASEEFGRNRVDSSAEDTGNFPSSGNFSDAAPAGKSPPDPPQSGCWLACGLCCLVGADAGHIRSIMKMRWIEIKSYFALFSMLNIVVPFMVVWVIVFSCNNNIYPELFLGSGAPVLAGLGEVLAGSGMLKHVDSGIQSNWVDSQYGHRGLAEAEAEAESNSFHAYDYDYDYDYDTTLAAKQTPAERAAGEGEVLGSAAKKAKKLLAQKKKLQPQQDALQGIFGDMLRWEGSTDSSGLEGGMSADLMKHPADRWGAIVVDDKVERFIDTSIYIPSAALTHSPDDIYKTATLAHKRICNESYDSYGQPESGRKESNAEKGGHRFWTLEKSLFFCGSGAATRIGVARNYNMSTGLSSSALVVSSYASLSANVSLLCNTTAHHAAPIFLKEIVPPAFAAMSASASASHAPTAAPSARPSGDPSDKHPGKQPKGGLSMEGGGRRRQREAKLALLDDLNGAPRYDLFSHPFPEIDLTNQTSMWRGYLGASFVLMFMLICSMASVRLITQLRASGVKHALHLAGVSCPSYWIANYICDVGIMFLILLCMYCGILLGGGPVSSFYFDLPPYSGVLFLAAIGAFSLAIVAADYACCALSVDPLVSQLACALSSVLVGVCLKLYCRLHKSDTSASLSTAMTIVSPSYAFTSALFDMFSQYADNIGKSGGVLRERNTPGLVAAVGFDVLMMLGQAVAYLILTVLVDKYWVRLKACGATVTPDLPRRAMRGLRRMLAGQRPPAPAAARPGGESLESMWGQRCRSGSGNSGSGGGSPGGNSNSSEGGEGEGEGDSLLSPFDPSSPPPPSSGSPSPDSERDGEEDLLGGVSVGIEAAIAPPGYAGTKAGIGIGAGVGIGIGAGAASEASPLLPRRPASSRDSVAVYGAVAGRSAPFPTPFPTPFPAPASASAPSPVSVPSPERPSKADSAAGGAGRDLSGDSDSDSAPPPPKPPRIGGAGLSVEYSLRDAPPALHALSLAVAQGDRVALVGVNGGGKSTLFRTLSCGTRNVPRGGAASVRGLSVASQAWEIFARRLVGYVPQEGGLLCFLTVRETIEMFASLVRPGPANNSTGSASASSASNTSSAVANALSVMDSKYLSYPVLALSGGNKKKLSIVLANMHTPAALLLDECTTGIDPEAADRVLEYLNANLASEQGLLFASHRVDECVLTCDKIVVLCEGRAVLHGPIRDFYDMATEFYLLDLRVINRTRSLSAIHEFVALMRRALLSRMGPSPHRQDRAGGHEQHGNFNSGNSVFTNVIVYSPTLVRVMCRKSDVPLSVMWTLVEEMSIAKCIRHYFFRDVGMEEVLSVLIGDTHVTLDQGWGAIY